MCDGDGDVKSSFCSSRAHGSTWLNRKVYGVQRYCRQRAWEAREHEWDRQPENNDIRCILNITYRTHTTMTQFTCEYVDYVWELCERSESNIVPLSVCKSSNSHSYFMFTSLEQLMKFSNKWFSAVGFFLFRSSSALWHYFFLHSTRCALLF